MLKLQVKARLILRIFRYQNAGDVDTGIKVAQLDRMLGYAGLG